jgi:serine/threonine protein kinase
MADNTKTDNKQADNKQLGPYELRGELGRGAMAKVWRAWDVRLEREVAIKEPLFDERLSDDVLEEMGSRFVKEGKAAARLNHPGIVTIYAADIYDKRPAIVMELIDGTTLGELLESGPLTPQATLDVLDQLLDAVGYAHSQGVIHRDIKPDNIFITKDGRVKLGDFGIAHIEDSSLTKKTQVGTVLGTPGYMAPEQATGAHVDARTDLFAIGTIAYEMLTGTNPFGAGEGTDSTTLLYRIVHEPAPELSDITREGLPADIRPAIVAALNKNPTERPQDAASFKAMLHGAPAPEPGTLPAASSTLAQASANSKSSKTKKWLPYVLVGAAGVVILLAVFIFATSGDTGGVVTSVETRNEQSQQPTSDKAQEEPEVERSDGEKAASADDAATNDDARASSNDDYIIPDSSSRYVTEAEVGKLSNWERFIARNEIFARHGRGFTDQRLRDYFKAKSWYSEQYSPEEFNTNLLNPYEKENANLIRSIEESAGSPYVS